MTARATVNPPKPESNIPIGPLIGCEGTAQSLGEQGREHCRYKRRSDAELDNGARRETAGWDHVICAVDFDFEFRPTGTSIAADISALR